MEGEDRSVRDGVNWDIVAEKHGLVRFWVVDVQVVGWLKVIENIADNIVREEDFSDSGLQRVVDVSEWG
jgi:hypothetical protein